MSSTNELFHRVGGWMLLFAALAKPVDVLSVEFLRCSVTKVTAVS